ncbi:hypothetical protein AAHA92_15619 [Salvia divinorum]|uniref:MULE transposase domain-containing protein n=1 Tax=Salvia divinorum TaxID=28513 RepID=A0ABD1HFD8_SALDI
MASYHWVGMQIEREKLYGTYENDFGNLFNFKEMVKLKMSWSVVKIGLKETEDGVYFQRFFCCFKPSINGFLNGCKPYLSVNTTALNDAYKRLENIVKAAFPWAEHKECFIHLKKNFSKMFQEVWNNRMMDLKDLPIAELVDRLRSRFMELYAKREDIGERLEGQTILPIVVRHLNVLGRQMGHLKVKVGGRGETEWPSMDLGFKVLPSLIKRAHDRQKKNRIPGCLEGRGNKCTTKRMWQEELCKGTTFRWDACQYIPKAASS